MKIQDFRTGRSSRRGGAMIAALLVVFAVATLSMIQLQLDLSKAREQRTAVDTKRAFYMAEAGLAEAFHGIASGKSGNVGTADEPARFANGIFFTTAKEEGLGRVTLTSTGLCGAGRAALSIVVERTSSSVASLGFFGDELVAVEGGATIDSYDSRKGPYSPPLLPVGGSPPTGAKVGSNQNLTVGGRNGTTKVYGNAQPGPTGVLVRGRSTTISGSTAPFLTANALEAIDVPVCQPQGSITTSPSKPLVAIPSGERQFDSLKVTGATKLVITGPAKIVVGQLVVDAQGEVTIDATKGPVELYVTDWLALKSGSKFTTGTSDPRSVSILVSASESRDRDGNGSIDPPVVLKPTGSLIGTLHAPSAEVAIPHTFPVFGAVSAKRLTVMTGAQVHFDESLLEAGQSDDGLPKLIGWRLVELPNVPMVKLRYDALRALAADGVTPVKSSVAHFDIGAIDDEDGDFKADN